MSKVLLSDELKGKRLRDSGIDLSDMHVELWGPLCFDLALNPHGRESVARSYGISNSKMERLLEIPAFCARLNEVQNKVETLGTSAGFVLSAQIHAEKHLLTLAQIADDVDTPTSVRMKAVENLVRYAQLDPSSRHTAEKEKEKERGGKSSLMVQFNIGGGLIGKEGKIEVMKQLRGEVESEVKEAEVVKKVIDYDDL